MSPACIIRFRPSGPWRIGPDSGARDHVDRIFHSDTLYSAVTNAMARLGELEEWITAVFRNSEGPAVRFSSCFPFQDDLLFVTPPRNLWPPAPSAKVRWKGARFVPLTLVAELLAEKPPDENQWTLDGRSECLLASGQSYGPFRTAVRSSAAVDRLSGNVAVHSTACLEFSRGSGMWTLAVFSGEEARDRWEGPVRSAFRLLADTGLGGERSRGWGKSEMPEFTEGLLPDLLLPPLPPPLPADAEAEPPLLETAYWLLSLFSPGASDSVDWRRGQYSLLTRGGRVESSVASGAPKKVLRMVEEGSVLFAQAPVRGGAPDVAPDGFPHPVYRAGFAVAIPIPWRVAA